MKKRIKMYGGKPPKPITSTGDSAPSDKTKTNNSGFREKKKTRKQNEAIKKNSIHIAKKISKLQGKIETSTAKKPHGTYVSKKKQGEIYKLTEALGKLQLQSAEIHKDGVLRGTQPPEPGKSTKALESPQTQSNNKTRQSEFQRGIENGISQKQFKSQKMYQSKQKYINNTKRSLSIESQKLLDNKEKLDLEIAAEKEAEKTKPQGEPKKPSFFNKISSLFKMKKKTKQNKLTNVEAKLKKLTKTQTNVDKYKEEQNKAYTAKQDNYARRLNILKTIPTATAKSNVPTTQTASTKLQSASNKDQTASTKLQQQPPKNKKQAEKQIAETHKIVEGETIKLREATEKIDEIDTKIASVKADYLKSIEELAKINLELDRVSNIDKNLDTKLEALQKKIDSNTLGQTSKEFDEYKELKAQSVIIKSKIEINKGKQRVADTKANTELIKEQNLQIEKEAAITIEKEAKTKVQEAENTLTQAAINLNKLSKTKKQRQAEEKKAEEEAEAIKAKKEAAAKEEKEEGEKAEAIKKAKEAEKKAIEAFKKTLPGLEEERNKLSENLETVKSSLEMLKREQQKAVGEFNVAKQNKSDADEIVRSQKEELKTIINENKEKFKANFTQKYPNVLLTGEIYLKAEENYINGIEKYNPVVSKKISDLEKSKEEANEYKKIYEQKLKNKYHYLEEIKTTKKDLASLDEQIKKINVNTPTNAG